MSVVTGISFGVFEQNIHIPLDERGLPLNRKHCSVIDTGKLITVFVFVFNTHSMYLAK